MDKSKALQNKLKCAINDQKERLPEIDGYIDFLKGKQYKAPKKDEVTFNIIHTTIQAILNSILQGQAHMYVEPLTAEAVGSETLVEKVINYYWKKLKIDEQLEFTVTDFAGLGLGIDYTDWDFRQDENGMITNDEPFDLNIAYKDFLIDPEVNPQEIMNAKYMIRKFVRPTKEIKADPRYKHTKNLKGDSKISEKIAGSTSGDVIERTTFYQLWVPEDSASYVMRDGSDDIYREVENKLGREYPFTLLQNYKMPGELFPFGDIKILYEPQKTLNSIFTFIIKHARKVSTRQYIANGQINKTELRKLKDAEDGEVLEVEGNVRAADVISPIMDAALSGDVYKAYEIINSAIVQLSSISEYRRSIMPQDQRKATEASYIEQGTQMSTNAKAEKVQKHCEEIARKLFILLKHPDNINSKSIIYKDEKTGQWIEQVYNNMSFNGEHSYRWESGIDVPLNQGTRYQKATALLNTISAVTKANPQLMNQINWTELLRSTLADSDIKNIEQILTPDPNMQQGMNQGIDPNTGQPINQGQGQPQGNVPPELMGQVMQNIQGGQ